MTPDQRQQLIGGPFHDGPPIDPLRAASTPAEALYSDVGCNCYYQLVVSRRWLFGIFKSVITIFIFFASETHPVFFLAPQGIHALRRGAFRECTLAQPNTREGEDAILAFVHCMSTFVHRASTAPHKKAGSVRLHPPLHQIMVIRCFLTNSSMPRRYSSISSII